jgi:hypothetical protein
VPPLEPGLAERLLRVRVKMRRAIHFHHN